MASLAHTVYRFARDAKIAKEAAPFFSELHRWSVAERSELLDVDRRADAPTLDASRSAIAPSKLVCCGRLFPRCSSEMQLFFSKHRAASARSLVGVNRVQIASA